MDAPTPQSQLEFRRLNSAYQEAWKRLRAEVGVWQSLTSNGIDGTAIKDARNRVGRAEASYRESRNKVADYMIAKIAPKGVVGDRNEMARAGQFRVERLAYQFWEEAGRRHGNAESDWYRAENVVQKSRRFGAAR